MMSLKCVNNSNHRGLFSVPGGVTSLNVTSPSSRKLSVTWQPSIENTCPVNHFIIGHRLLQRGQCGNSPAECVTTRVNPQRSMDTFAITLNSLFPNSLYRVSVKGVNNAGAGQNVTVPVTTRSRRKHDKEILNFT